MYRDGVYGDRLCVGVGCVYCGDTACVSGLCACVCERETVCELGCLEREKNMQRS